jgi:hypothetical protein
MSHLIRRLRFNQRPQNQKCNRFKSHALHYIIIATESLKFPQMSLYNHTTSAAHDGVVFGQHMGTAVAMDQEF